MTPIIVPRFDRDRHSPPLTPEQAARFREIVEEDLRLDNGLNEKPLPRWFWLAFALFVLGLCAWGASR